MTEMDFLRALQGGREDPWDIITGESPAATPALEIATSRGARRGLRLERLPGEDYWPWFARVLAHPDGRAQGGEPCDHCGTPIDAGAAWQHRDRHVCGSRCNESLKRRLTRAIAESEELGGRSQ